MTQWRDDPRLKGRFHPEYPDDLQVVIHEGGFRLSKNPPELAWVRVVERQGDVFKGRLLNKPFNLATIQEGSIIEFVVPAGGEHLVMVTEKYISERPQWSIHPCPECGFSELLDAPSDFIRVVFPGIPAGEVMTCFTYFCPFCRTSGLVVENKALREGELPRPSDRPRKRWWKFWE